MQQAAHDSSNEVESHKAANTHQPLQDRPREPKPSHVHHQMQDSSMHKLVCYYLPKRTLRYPSRAQAKKLVDRTTILPTGEGTENENENVYRNQNFDCSELNFLPTIDHFRNLATAASFVHLQEFTRPPTRDRLRRERVA